MIGILSGWWYQHRGQRFSGGQAFVGPRDVMGDEVVEPMLQTFGGDPDRIGNGPFAGRTMGLHHGAVKSEQGRAPLHVWIDAAFDRSKSVLELVQ